jgi:hypothetical protein
MFDAFDREDRKFSDFAGNAIFLAMQLDPSYLGEYAETLKGSTTVESCASMGDAIVEVEQPPTSAEVIASPSKRNNQSPDAFLLQLLHTYRRRKMDPRRIDSPTVPTPPQQRRRIVSDNPVYSTPGSRPQSFTIKQ